MTTTNTATATELKVADLRKQAKALGVAGYNKMNKAKLLNAIEAKMQTTNDKPVTVDAVIVEPATVSPAIVDKSSPTTQTDKDKERQAKLEAKRVELEKRGIHGAQPSNAKIQSLINRNMSRDDFDLAESTDYRVGTKYRIPSGGLHTVIGVFTDKHGHTQVTTICDRLGKEWTVNCESIKRHIKNGKWIIVK